MKLLLILFSSLLSISAQSSLGKEKILLEKLILETKKSLYNSTFEIAKQECASLKGVSLERCYQNTLNISKAILTRYKKEATVVIQDASRNKHKYFSLHKDGRWRLDGQNLEVKDGAEMNIKILQSELQKKWQETIQKVGNPKGNNLNKRGFMSLFRGLFKGGSSRAARHADEIAGASSKPLGRVDPPGQVPRNAPFSQALDAPPKGKRYVPPTGKADDAAEMAELHKNWLKLNYKTLFATRISRVLRVVFGGIGLYTVMKFFFGTNEELPTFDEGSATFPDPFANDGSTVTFDDSQMDPFQQNFGYANHGGYQPGYAKDTQYGDIIDPETGYYWKFDPAAKAYYRWDDNTYERVYYKE